MHYPYVCTTIALLYNYCMAHTQNIYIIFYKKMQIKMKKKDNNEYLVGVILSIIYILPKLLTSGIRKTWMGIKNDLLN